MENTHLFWVIIAQFALLASTNLYAYSAGYGRATKLALARQKELNKKNEKPKEDKTDIYAPRYNQKDFQKQREEDRKYVAENKGKVKPLTQKNQGKSDAIDRNNYKKKV